MTDTNEPEHSYDTIKVHQYEHLDRGGRNTGRVPEPLEMAESEERKQSKKSCSQPPWWGLLLIILGIGILCTLVTLLVILFPNKTSPERMPAASMYGTGVTVEQAPIGIGLHQAKSMFFPNLTSAFGTCIQKNVPENNVFISII